MNFTNRGESHIRDLRKFVVNSRKFAIFMFDFIRYRNIFFIISGVALTASILALIFFGFRLGIDFNGGSMMEVEYQGQRPANPEIQKILAELDLGEIKVQVSGDQGVILRFKEISEETHQQILSSLGNVEEKRFESIGPVIGQELKTKAKWAVFLALLAIIFYIVWAFRKIARLFGQGESWRYGFGAILALTHDVLIVFGFFAFMGHFKGMEIDAAFIIAILTVLGYSVNDTIVVYDRIRENLLVHKFKTLTQTVNASINETLIRSLNTSLTTIFALLAVCFFGGDSIRGFILAMIIGIAVGTYSSIAVASQFLLFKRIKIK